MTKIVIAPQIIDFHCGKDYKKLFLAGGITNVRDWQTDMCDHLLVNLPNLLIYNPRRKIKPLKPDEDARQQIFWEWQALNAADAISFWFSLETSQPITLFELGRWTAFTEPKLELAGPLIEGGGIMKLRMDRKKLFVGIHPQYKRKLDVEYQLKIQCPDQKIVYTLEDLASQISEWCNC